MTEKGRICTKCTEFKLFSEFYKDKSKKFGVNNSCKLCVLLHNKTYYKNNKEKIIDCSTQYYINNKEKIVYVKQQYYKNNKTKASGIKEQ